MHLEKLNLFSKDDEGEKQMFFSYLPALYSNIKGFEAVIL